MSIIASSSKAWGSQRRQLARLVASSTAARRTIPVIISLSHPSRDYKNRYLITHLASLSRRVSRYLSRNKLDRSRVVFSRRNLSTLRSNTITTASSSSFGTIDDQDDDGLDDFIPWKSLSNSNNSSKFPSTPSSSASSRQFPMTPQSRNTSHQQPRVTPSQQSELYTLSSSTPSSSSSSSSSLTSTTPFSLASSYTNGTTPSSSSSCFFLASSPNPAYSLLTLDKTTETPTSSQFSKRLSDFVASHSPFYAATTESRKMDRIRKFLNECKTTRNQIFNIRRGYWVCGLGNESFNLGNELHISEMDDRRLDRDRDQSGPSSTHIYQVRPSKKAQTGGSITSSPSLESLAFFTHPLAYSPSPISSSSISYHPSSSSSTTASSDTPSALVDCNIVTIQGQKLLKSSTYHHSKFNQADRIVKETFLQRGIDADLSFVVERGFTVDMCVVREEEATSSDNSVLGCTMYVMMRNYVWVEEIAVKEEWRSCGVGTALVERLKQVSVHRGKDILLYALASAIPFYKSRGFVQLDRWNADCKSFEGRYMVWTKDQQQQQQI